MRIAITGLVLVWLGVLSAYDVRQRRLPNGLTLPGAAAILLAAVAGGWGMAALAGATALSAVYLLVHLVAPTAMGAGDVKLAIGLGGLAGCFGADVWFLAALAAPLLSVLAGLGMRWRGVQTVPHGLSMCMATAGAAGMALLG
ncbi:Flp pilus assembly protein, protease CpaA [Mycobacterium basiliense]|uniref:Flp pilus assembly protein, protease CpaA n=1 Tax=Mycobacterium basiliense TaxID=2094119 RepID=A0A447GDB7_9MYCO|nr:A24 family peptidase [Mycobacterium basiliense]VDM88435.1 Flp pilus assembly protein, protease CpaA [Mycobacterium basiliense]